MYTGFSNEEDRAKAEAFFQVRIHGALYADPARIPTLLQDKDIGKYNQALAQALDGISAKAAFIKVRRNCRAYSFLHSDSCHESVQLRMLSPGWRNGSPSGS